MDFTTLHFSVHSAENFLSKAFTLIAQLDPKLTPTFTGKDMVEIFA